MSNLFVDNITNEAGTAAPTTVTAAAATNTTQIATTAFVQQEVAWGYTSPETTPTAAASMTTLAHGLGAIPTKLRVVLRCKIAEIGYSVGDEAEPWIYSSYVRTSDISNIYLSKYTNASWYLVPKAGGASTPVTVANWKLIVMASL